MGWGEIVLLAGGFMTLMGALGFVFKKIVPGMRDVSRQMDRFQGVPANPRTGQAAIPSLWEILQHQSDELAVIKHEVEFNNGSSVKDAVVRNEKATNELSEKFDNYVAHGQASTITVNTGTPA